MLNKKISLIITTLTLSLSLLSAKDTRCQKDAHYYEDNFASATNPEHFNLAWAKCEKHLGNDDLSVSAYERVLLYNATNMEAVLALVPLYAKLGMDKDAKILIEDMDKETLTSSQKTQLSKLKKEQSLGINTTFNSTIGYGYDTNLNYSIFTENNILPIASNVESSFYTFDVKGKATYEFQDVRGLSLGTNVQFYKKDNKEGDYFDLTYGKVDIGLGYNTSKVSLYLPLIYQRVKYLNRDLYQQIGISPKLTLSLEEELLLNIGVQYTKREYKESVDKNANDTLLNASIGLYHFFGDSYLYSQFDYGKNRADASSPTRFTEYNFFHLFSGLNYNLKSYQSNLGINYQYSYKDYADSTTTTATRLDEFQQINPYLKKEINPHWDVKVEYSAIHNRSNYALIDYEKQISSIGLEYTY